LIVPTLGTFHGLQWGCRWHWKSGQSISISTLVFTRTGSLDDGVPIGFGLIDNAIRLVSTRNFVKPRTALYMTWLLFRDEALATEFLEGISEIPI
jgi:hypothetical protein